MVYCGKPSKSCDACRAKRTKCDRAVPSCTQCLRVGRVCPGYRDAQALLFRDETLKVADRVVTKNDRSVSPPNTAVLLKPGQPSSHNGNVVIDFSSSQAFVMEPSRSLEEEGLNFFFYHYVLQENSFAKGLFDWLPRMYTHTLATNEPLKEIIKASGMAGIANLKRSSDIGAVAREKQTLVLRSVNTSLRNPHTATLDTTMMAVLLLGLYETITCTTPQSMQAWANHIKGAVTLCQLRGRGQFESPVGRRIFLHLRNQVLINCLQRRERMPDMVREWLEPSDEVKTERGTAEPRLFRLLTRVCDLRHLERINGNLDASMAAEASALEAELEAWADTISTPGLKYKVVFKPDAKDYPKYSHIYNSLWLATAWNTWRVGRIFATSIIIQWNLKNIETKPEAANIVERMKAARSQLCDDICASVPYYLGEVTRHAPQSRSAMKAAGGYALLWPLYTAAHPWHGCPERTAWIVAQYEKINDAYGIRQAKALAKVLEANKEITVFDRDLPTKVAAEMDDDEDW